MLKTAAVATLAALGGALATPLGAQAPAGAPNVPRAAMRLDELARRYPERIRQKMLTVDDVSDFRQDPATGVSNYYPGGPRSPINPAYTFPSSSTPPTGQNNPRYATPYGGGFDGVARLEIRIGGQVTFGCSGALIDSRTVLTAAHCVSAGGGRSGIFASGVDATFLNADGGTTVIKSSGIKVMRGYTGSVVEQRDLALIELERPADPWITRYELFRGNPLFREVTTVGYGSTGNGITGATVSTLFDPVPVRRQTQNRFEYSLDETFIYAGDQPFGAILQADFDGGRNQVLRFPTTGDLWSVGGGFFNNWNCVIGIFAFEDLPDDLLEDICLDDSATGRVGSANFMEGLIGGGDSGGPAFVNVNGRLQLAGVASFGDQFCVPDQRLDAETGLPDPRTDSICEEDFGPGYIAIGSIYGATAGHVFVGAGDQYRFVAEIPEPSTVLLLVGGLVPLALVARRRRP